MKNIASIMDYIRSHFVISPEAGRMLSAALNAGCDCVEKRKIIEAMLRELGLNKREINDIMVGRVPKRKVCIPVYARYNLGVKVWVTVDEDASDDDIKEAAIEKILFDGDYDADEGFDQYAEDISVYEIDREGQQEEEDEE